VEELLPSVQFNLSYTDLTDGSPDHLTLGMKLLGELEQKGRLPTVKSISIRDIVISDRQLPMPSELSSIFLQVIDLVESQITTIPSGVLRIMASLLPWKPLEEINIYQATKWDEPATKTSPDPVKVRVTLSRATL